MGDPSSIFGGASAASSAGGGDLSSLGDGTDPFGGSGGPDLSSLFSDAGLGSALLGDSSGLGGIFSTVDPSGTQAATESLTPPADIAGTPSGSDPSANIGGTQSAGPPQPNQPQPPAKTVPQDQSPLGQLAKFVKSTFGLGEQPTAGGPTGPTPKTPPTIEGLPPPGDASTLIPPFVRGKGFLGGIPGAIYNTMRATPAETGELPYGGYQGDPNQPARPVTPTPTQAPGPEDPTIQAGGPGAGAQQPPAAPAQPAPAETPAPAASDPPQADLPTKKGPQASGDTGAVPGPIVGQGGPTGDMGEIGGILRDVLGLALANPTILPMLAQAIMGGMGRRGGGIPPWAMMGMMPFMRGRGRGFGPFRGGFLRPGYYPHRQGGWGFHPGGYHPGWGAWAPGQRNNQMMRGGPAPGAFASGASVPPGTGPGSRSTRADQNLNPGNIMWGPWAQAHGAIRGMGNDQGHLVAVFPSAQAGWKAMSDLAGSKYRGGMRSINQLIATPHVGWTPGNYQAAANIARSMGIRPDADAHLDDPAMLALFMRALATQEGAPNLVASIRKGGTQTAGASPASNPPPPPAQRAPVQSDDFATLG